jgi:hypothetical protein
MRAPATAFQRDTRLSLDPQSSQGRAGTRQDPRIGRCRTGPLLLHYNQDRFVKAWPPLPASGMHGRDISATKSSDESSALRERVHSLIWQMTNES